MHLNLYRIVRFSFLMLYVTNTISISLGIVSPGVKIINTASEPSFYEGLWVLQDGFKLCTLIAEKSSVLIKRSG